MCRCPNLHLIQFELFRIGECGGVIGRAWAGRTVTEGGIQLPRIGRSAAHGDVAIAGDHEEVIAAAPTIKGDAMGGGGGGGTR